MRQPLVNKDALTAGLKQFARHHGVTLKGYGTRQAQALEIARLLSAAQHYQIANYRVVPENLESVGLFRIKLTTSQYPRRYSYFSVGIFGNLPVLGHYKDDGASYVVDVGVAKVGTVIEAKKWPGLPPRESRDIR